MTETKRSPHPATVQRRQAPSGERPTVGAGGARPPHPATVIQRRQTGLETRQVVPPHAAMLPRGGVVQRKAPHPATIAMDRPPHPGTVAQRRAAPSDEPSSVQASTKGLNKGKDAWEAAEEAIATYSGSKEMLDWLKVRKALKMKAPVIRGHGSGKSGQGMNKATQGDLAEFLSTTKAEAFAIWGDAVGDSATEVKLSKCKKQAGI